MRSTCSLFRSLVFRPWGRLFMRTEGARARGHRNKTGNVTCQSHRVAASAARLRPDAVRLGWTYKALMCSTNKAMRCFLRFYLSGGLLHIHDGLAQAHPKATLLFRLGEKRASSTDFRMLVWFVGRWRGRCFCSRWNLEQRLKGITPAQIGSFDLQEGKNVWH